MGLFLHTLSEDRKQKLLKWVRYLVFFMLFFIFCSILSLKNTASQLQEGAQVSLVTVDDMVYQHYGTFKQFSTLLQGATIQRPFLISQINALSTEFKSGPYDKRLPYFIERYAALYAQIHQDSGIQTAPELQPMLKVLNQNYTFLSVAVMAYNAQISLYESKRLSPLSSPLLRWLSFPQLSFLPTVDPILSPVFVGDPHLPLIY